MNSSTKLFPPRRQTRPRRWSKLIGPYRLIDEAESAGSAGIGIVILGDGGQIRDIRAGKQPEQRVKGGVGRVQRQHPSAGAVNDHQMDLPPGFPAMSGSPTSLLAFVLPMETTPLVLVNRMALTKKSLATVGTR